MTQLQQGDVLLWRVSGLPDGERENIAPTERGHVLAEGEATGHAHTIDASHGTMTRIGARLFVDIAVPTRITHEEHHAIALEPGLYEVGRVQEYDYLAQMARPVAD